MFTFLFLSDTSRNCVPMFCPSWFILCRPWQAKKPSEALPEVSAWTVWWMGTRGWPTTVDYTVKQRTPDRGIFIRAHWTWVTQHAVSPPPTTRCSLLLITDRWSHLQWSLHCFVSSCLSELFWSVSWRTSSHLPPERSQLLLAASHQSGSQ